MPICHGKGWTQNTDSYVSKDLLKNADFRLWLLGREWLAGLLGNASQRNLVLDVTHWSVLQCSRKKKETENQKKFFRKKVSQTRELNVH